MIRKVKKYLKSMYSIDAKKYDLLPFLIGKKLQSVIVYGFFLVRIIHSE